MRQGAKGEGIPQDYKEAVKWYRKAAEQGHVSAQLDLAALYVGPLNDLSQAVKWLKQAHLHGHEKARLWIDKICEEKPEVCN